jgi:ferredoxin-type protein NapF
MNKTSKIPGLRTLSAVLAIILALPIPINGFTGFYLWLSPFIMLNSVIALKTLVLLNLAALIILIPIIFKKRWFCQNLCPVGWGCDLISGLRKDRSYSYDTIPEIGKWLAIISLTATIAGIPLFIFIDPLAIFHGFFSVFIKGSGIITIILSSGFLILLFIHFFLPGIWCKKLCPLGGMQMAIAELKYYIDRISGRKKSDNQLYNPGRRYLLMSGTGLIAGFSIRKLYKPLAGNVIRPPASAGTTHFNSLCCRCGNCIRACPTKIISSRIDYADILSLMTPEISFKSGYCLEECNLCSRVCPTGAITLFDPAAKNQLFMGKAEINLENCLLLNNKECNKCRSSCKYEAIEFKTGSNILNMSPVVDFRKCVGCGACMVVCPTNCIFVKPIE